MFTFYKFTFHISWRKSNELSNEVIEMIYDIYMKYNVSAS